MKQVVYDMSTRKLTLYPDQDGFNLILESVERGRVSCISIPPAAAGRLCKALCDAASAAQAIRGDAEASFQAFVAIENAREDSRGLA